LNKVKEILLEYAHESILSYKVKWEGEFESIAVAVVEAIVEGYEDIIKPIVEMLLASSSSSSSSAL
jgi:hypothetical protein